MIARADAIVWCCMIAYAAYAPAAAALAYFQHCAEWCKHCSGRESRICACTLVAGFPAHALGRWSTCAVVAVVAGCQAHALQCSTITLVALVPSTCTARIIVSLHAISAFLLHVETHAGVLQLQSVRDRCDLPEELWHRLLRAQL
jgi:hypothetical protein